jgi:putative Mg2+ transporter-C (MgtC) family protein
MLNDPDITQQVTLLVKVALAMVLGGIIGYEREQAERPAGFRTHIIMAGSAALIVSVGTAIADYFRPQIDNDSLTVDPIRLIEATIVGVSFLGAGTIMRRPEQDRIDGLTTGASLLFVAAIGVAVATGQLVLAIGATLLVLITRRGITWLENRQPS